MFAKFVINERFVTNEKFAVDENFKRATRSDSGTNITLVGLMVEIRSAGNALHSLHS